jgi:hypothetical protein
MDAMDDLDVAVDVATSGLAGEPLRVLAPRR